MAGKATLFLPMLQLMLVLVQKGESVWLNLPKSGGKCVTEDVHSNAVVVAEYVVMYDPLHPSPTITITVTSRNGNIIHHKENVTHDEFAFTSNEAGLYVTCFTIDHPSEDAQISVNFDWKVGAAAKDWDSIAKKEKIEGVELELKKLAGAVEEIHEIMLYRKTREAKMREASETTNSRVAWYGISSLGICISASCAQLWYLTRFFQKKKLV